MTQGTPGSEHAVGELRCGEFRHGDSFTRSMHGFFWELPEAGAIFRARVTAANVPEPTELIVKVNLNLYELDLLQALEQLPDDQQLLKLVREAIETAGPDETPGFRLPSTAPQLKGEDKP